MAPASHPEDHEQIRAAVTARYSSLARAALSGQPVTDCGPEAFAAGCSGAAGYDDISELPDGAVRASLGCGNPVAVAELHPGEIVLDLGSGGGIDVLLSARRVSPGGKAYGLDASPDMIVLAQENAAQAGVTNAEFLHGPIEDIPLPDGHVDVVISNCVINLSADKPRALAAAFRVLRPYGRLGISDIIADGGLDPVQRAEAEQLTGCTTGTLTADEYHGLLLASGFTGIRITAIQAAGPGLRSAIIQARRPAAPVPRAAGAAAPGSKTYMLLSADGAPQSQRDTRPARRPPQEQDLRPAGLPGGAARDRERRLRHPPCLLRRRADRHRGRLPALRRLHARRLSGMESPMITLPVGYRPAAAHHHVRTPRSMRRSRSVRDGMRLVGGCCRHQAASWKTRARVRR